MTEIRRRWRELEKITGYSRTRITFLVKRAIPGTTPEKIRQMSREELSAAIRKGGFTPLGPPVDRTKVVEVGGVSRTLREWACVLKLKETTLQSRIWLRGYDAVRAIEESLSGGFLRGVVRREDDGRKTKRKRSTSNETADCGGG